MNPGEFDLYGARSGLPYRWGRWRGVVWLLGPSDVNEATAPTVHMEVEQYLAMLCALGIVRVGVPVFVKAAAREWWRATADGGGVWGEWVNVGDVSLSEAIEGYFRARSIAEERAH